MDCEWIKEHKISLILGFGSVGLVIYKWMKHRKKQVVTFICLLSLNSVTVLDYFCDSQSQRSQYPCFKAVTFAKSRIF